MAWGGYTNLGTNTNKASSASWASATWPVNPVPEGAIVVLVLATDNIATASGSSNTHQSVSDGAGNVWTKLIEWTRSLGAAADGATVSIWICQAWNPIAAASGLTMQFSAAVTAKAFVSRYYTVDAGNTWQVDGAAGADGSSTTPSVTLSGLSAVSRNWIGALGYEGTATVTNDADYATQVQTTGTSGGSAATNIRSYAARNNGYPSITSDTFNPTLSAASNWAAVLVALTEVPLPTISGSGALTTGPVQVQGSGSVAAPGVSGSGSLSTGPVSAAASGAVRVSGSGATAVRPIAASGSGGVQAVATGAANLPGLSTAGSGATAVRGSGAATLGPASAQGSGAIRVSGSAAADLRPVAAQASGAVRISGAGAADLPAASASGSATATGVLSGTGAAELGALEALGAAAVGIAASGVAALRAPAAVGVGSAVAVMDLRTARRRFQAIGRRGGPVYPDPEHDGSLDASWFARWLDDEL